MDQQVFTPMTDSDHYGYEYLQKIVSGKWKIPQIHTGYDFNKGPAWSDEGLPIKAMFDGRVIFSAYVKGWGHLVIIRHDLPFYINVDNKSINVFWTRSAHLKERHVQLNDEVKGGDVIGLCGHTGGSWPPHCHHDIPILHLPSHFAGGWTSYTSWWSVKKAKEYYGDFYKIKTALEEELKKKYDKEFIRRERELDAAFDKFKRTGLVKKTAQRRDPMTLGDYAEIYFRQNPKNNG